MVSRTPYVPRFNHAHFIHCRLGNLIIVIIVVADVVNSVIDIDVAILKVFSSSLTNLRNYCLIALIASSDLVCCETSLRLNLLMHCGAL